MASPTPADVIAELRRLHAAYDRPCPMAMAPWDLVKGLVNHADALLAIAEAADAQITRNKGNPTNNPNGASWDHALDAALRRLAPTTKETDR